RAQTNQCSKSDAVGKANRSKQAKMRDRPGKVRDTAGGLEGRPFSQEAAKEWARSNQATRARAAAATPTTTGYQPVQSAATNGAMRATCLPRNSSSAWLRIVGQILLDIAMHLP